MQATNEIRTKIRGTTFRGFDWDIPCEGDKVHLVREPDNAYDPNAIKCVHSGAGFLGYVGRDLAAQLAPTIDQGATAAASILDITGGTDAAPNRGINLLITVSQEV